MKEGSLVTNTIRKQGSSARANARAGKAASAALGSSGEAQALRYLERQGMTLLTRNYRVARGPGAFAGEVDLIMRDRDGTLVFVEVRTRSARTARSHGGAAASVGLAKQRRLIYAARHYLSRLPSCPPCRFDVVAVDGDEVTWLRAAFDAAA